MGPSSLLNPGAFLINSLALFCLSARKDFWREPNSFSPVCLTCILYICYMLPTPLLSLQANLNSYLDSSLIL